MTETARVIDFQQARARRVARANEPWLSKREIAAHFGVSVRTITRWMQDGMPYRKRYEQAHPRFQISRCEEWMEAGR
jgi:transposase